MGGLINLIKKLFSGIFSFVGGLLGGKKNGGYYMEADESKFAPLPSKSDAENSAKPEPAKVEATSSGAKAEPVKAAKASVAELSNAEPVKAVKNSVGDSAKAVQASLKSATGADKEKAAPAKAESAKQDAASTNGSQPPAPANVALNMPKPTVSFASEYLAPKPTSTRRRPGANMNSFLEMAKNVKPST
ncbi:MAG: hypothetical protein KME43_04265 [Myxacorys chilensis ATA2-1-KO14]|jgi:cytoskeletal protein RodZ|nr:hypothetical protein [Myxacorys chilensis ATA2-1-KO14]